jgi:hypothetical protein
MPDEDASGLIPLYPPTAHQHFVADVSEIGVYIVRLIPKRMGDDGWDPGASERIYKYIFMSVAESMGRVFVENMAGVREEDFIKDQPRDSVLKLVDSLNKWFGPQVMHGIFLNIETEFRDAPSQRILQELKAQMG